MKPALGSLMSKAELRYQAIENSGLHVCLGDQLVPL